MNIYDYICNAIKLEMSVNAAFANYVKIFIKIAYFPGCYSWGFFIYNNLKNIKTTRYINLATRYNNWTTKYSINTTRYNVFATRYNDLATRLCIKHYILISYRVNYT